MGQKAKTFPLFSPMIYFSKTLKGFWLWFHKKKTHLSRKGAMVLRPSAGWIYISESQAKYSFSRNEQQIKTRVVSAFLTQHNQYWVYLQAFSSSELCRREKFGRYFPMKFFSIYKGTFPFSHIDTALPLFLSMLSFLLGGSFLLPVQEYPVHCPGKGDTCQR